jgi:hypothetical protein
MTAYSPFMFLYKVRWLQKSAEMKLLPSITGYKLYIYKYNEELREEHCLTNIVKTVDSYRTDQL